MIANYIPTWFPVEPPAPREPEPTPLPSNEENTQ